MPEDQNIEYKESWRDEYLKTVCGFANANGGIIYIGKDDRGELVGVNDPNKLMEDIPNKINSLLGIVCDVNLHNQDERPFIEIIVRPYDSAISYHGVYYYRSGSTKQEMKGQELQNFLLRKMGLTWDEVIETKSRLNDIDASSIKSFVEGASKSNRLPGLENEDEQHVLDNLRLIDQNKLKRAGLLLFGKTPDQFYPGAVLKIGRFGISDSDLKFQEIIGGSIFQMAELAIEILNRKFFTSTIHYEGLQRIEKSPYPVKALREIFFNAIAHRNYFGSPIQVSVYDYKLVVWNEGTLPEGLTLENLKVKHPSRPRNPLIADVFLKVAL